VNSINRIVALQDEGFLLLSRTDQSDILYSILLYMFRVSSSSDLTLVLKEKMGWSGQECIDFRQSFKVRGYIYRDLKLYIHARLTDSMVKVKGIKEEDQRMVSSVLRSKHPKAVWLKKRCKAYARNGYTAKSVETMNSVLTNMTPVLKTHCAKFVSKKFRFLTQSGQLDKEDVIQGLIEFGLYAIYKAYPVIESSLHMTNIAKTAIHNRGINILKEQTTSSRSRVKKSEDGTFVGTLLSLSAASIMFLDPAMQGRMSVCNSLMTGLDGRSVEHERPDYVDRRRDLETVVQGLYEKAEPKDKKFLELLMGLADKKFSEWLGSPNDEFMIKTDRKIYVEKVREYLRIPREKARQFFINLRSELVDFRN
jgi:hypothetical protein